MTNKLYYSATSGYYVHTQPRASNHEQCELTYRQDEYGRFVYKVNNRGLIHLFPMSTELNQEQESQLFHHLAVSFNDNLAFYRSPNEIHFNLMGDYLTIGYSRIFNELLTAWRNTLGQTAKTYTITKGALVEEENNYFLPVLFYYGRQCEKEIRVLCENRTTTAIAKALREAISQFTAEKSEEMGRPFIRRWRSNQNGMIIPSLIASMNGFSGYAFAAQFQPNRNDYHQYVNATGRQDATFYHYLPKPFFNLRNTIGIAWPHVQDENKKRILMEAREQYRNIQRELTATKRGHLNDDKSMLSAVISHKNLLVAGRDTDYRGHVFFKYEGRPRYIRDGRMERLNDTSMAMGLNIAMSVVKPGRNEFSRFGKELVQKSCRAINGYGQWTYDMQQWDFRLKLIAETKRRLSQPSFDRAAYLAAGFAVSEVDAHGEVTVLTTIHGYTLEGKYSVPGDVVMRLKFNLRSKTYLGGSCKHSHYSCFHPHVHRVDPGNWAGMCSGTFGNVFYQAFENGPKALKATMYQFLHAFNKESPYQEICSLSTRVFDLEKQVWILPSVACRELGYRDMRGETECRHEYRNQGVRVRQETL